MSINLVMLFISKRNNQKGWYHVSKVLIGSTFDFVAAHYCGSSIYHVSRHQQGDLETHIPNNLFNMTREEMSSVVKSIMKTMNILGYSINGTPKIPEKFGEYTVLSIRSDRIFMAGIGGFVVNFNSPNNDI